MEEIILRHGNQAITMLNLLMTVGPGNIEGSGIVVDGDIFFFFCRDL